MRGRGRRQARGRGPVARRGAGRGRCCESGPARALLAAERTALNFLGHLSGIATLTARFVEAVAGTGARDPRHAQDDAGAARAGEGGGRRRRRAQPPHGPLRRDPDQGEPHRPRRRPREGGPRGPQRPSRPGGRGRVPRPRRGRLRARRPAPTACCSTTWTRRPCARRCGCATRTPAPARARRWRPPAASTSTRSARSPRPGVDFISVGALTHSAPTPRLQHADRAGVERQPDQRRVAARSDHARVTSDRHRSRHGAEARSAGFGRASVSFTGADGLTAATAWMLAGEPNAARWARSGEGHRSVLAARIRRPARTAPHLSSCDSRRSLSTRPPVCSFGQ